MRFAIISLLIGVSFAVTTAHTTAAVGNSTQTDKSGQSINQQNADVHKEPKFRLTIMSNGIVKSGASFGGMTFIDESSGMKVWRNNVYLRSADSARKEFDDEVADDIESGGQLKPDKRAVAAPEKRAVVALPSKDGCAEPTTIRFTDGAILREVYSCSSEVAHEFEEYLRASMAAAKAHDAH